MNTLVPLFVDLTGQRCLVVGGGNVARRKVKSLLEGGARVVIVSPVVSAELRGLAERGEVQWLERGFVPADLDGMRLVFAATDRREVNRLVGEAAAERGIFCNLADRPEDSTFQSPAVLRRNDLTIAVSTGGRSPTLARDFRDLLDRLVPTGAGAGLDHLLQLRSHLQSRVESPRARREIWRQAVDRGLIGLVERGEVDAAAALLADAARAEAGA